MAKSYHEMNLHELQRERGFIDAEIQRRVLGDPRIGFHVGPDGSYSTMNGIRLCSDCPPENYPTDRTRCDACPRRQ